MHTPCMMMTITKFRKHVSPFPKIAPQNCLPLHRNGSLLLWRDNKLIIGTSSAREWGTGYSKRNIIVHLYHISSFYDLLLTFYRFITATVGSLLGERQHCSCRLKTVGGERRRHMGIWPSLGDDLLRNGSLGVFGFFFLSVIAKGSQ